MTTSAGGAAGGRVQYVNEADGQREFFKPFRLQSDEVLAYNTDGVHKGNPLEFETSISDLNAALFQAVEYLSKLRVRGVDVPADILLVDLNQRTVDEFPAADFDAETHTVHNTAASRNNSGFARKAVPETVTDHETPEGARQVTDYLGQTGVHPVRLTADCVVAWAERYCREVPNSNKNTAHARWRPEPPAPDDGNLHRRLLVLPVQLPERRHRVGTVRLPAEGRVLVPSVSVGTTECR